jgi:hypothetical protein
LLPLLPLLLPLPPCRLPTLDEKPRAYCSLGMKVREVLLGSFTTQNFCFSLLWPTITTAMSGLRLRHARNRAV